MNGKEEMAKTETAAGKMPDKLKKLYMDGFLTKEEFERHTIEALCRSKSGGQLSMIPGKCPDGVIDPRKQEAHRYHDCARIVIDFQSDSEKDELLMTAQKDGEIRIINYLGLTAVIREISWTEKEDCLIGKGWIEG